MYENEVKNVIFGIRLGPRVSHLFTIVSGPKPEKTEGLDADGTLLPVSRLLNNPETAPTHLFEDLAKSGYRPGKILLPYSFFDRKVS